VSELALARRLPQLAPGPRGDPPPELDPASFAEGLYVALAPLARQDASYGWALLILCNAIGTLFQVLEDYARDSPEGPGWSALMDLDRCPPEALPWLAQFVGVRLLPDSTPAEQRARIVATGGFRRGTPAALIGAAQATLTGNKTVVFRERDHDPADTPAYAYYLTVITYVSETPDPTATHNALLAQKPGGIVLDYRTAAGQDYQTLETGNADYAAVTTRYLDYTALQNAEG
jgi:Phage tail protein (Tail_P2_I)